MSKKYDCSHWGWDLFGCIGIIYLFSCDYQILLAPSSFSNKGDILTNIFILVNKYLGEIGVYLVLVGLFLWFLISAIRKIWNNNER